jgi:hypothetical protein
VIHKPPYGRIKASLKFSTLRLGKEKAAAIRVTTWATFVVQARICFQATQELYLDPNSLD